MAGYYYLFGRVTAGIAGEDIAIDMGHTTIPGIVNGGRTIRIHTATRAIDTYNSEAIAIALQAGEAGS